MNYFYFIKRLIFLLVIIFFCGQGIAQTTDQNYPVTAQAFVVGQSGKKLSAYFSNTQALTVSLLLKDLTKTNVDVYLRWSIDGPGVRIASVDGYIPPTFINLQRGMLQRFSGLDLQSTYFRQELIEAQGLAGPVMRSSLPEGFYTFRVQALEAGTGREVSNMGETYFSITSPLPPVINIPSNGVTLASTGSATGVSATGGSATGSLSLSKGVVQIQWMPRHYKLPGNITSYDLKVCKIPDGYQPQEAMDACVNPIIDDRGNPGTFYPSNTGIGNSIIGEWEQGARYAVRVTIHEFDQNGDEVVFANQGRSEVTWFRYGEPCLSPSEFNIKEISANTDSRRTVQLSWQASGDDRLGYNVLYRKQGEVTWTEQVAEKTRAIVQGLTAGTFEFAVKSNCSPALPANITTYTFNVKDEGKKTSDEPLNPLLITVSTSGPGLTLDSLRKNLDPDKFPCASQVSKYENCDAPLPVVTPKGTKQLTVLNPGDLLTIYDMVVIVTDARNNGGAFSGKGLARLPFIQNTKGEAMLTPVEFDGVKAYSAELPAKGGCVYEVGNPSSPGYFRTRSATPAVINQELAQAGGSGNSGKDFTGNIEQALEAIDSLTTLIASGSGTAQTDSLLTHIRGAVVTATEKWIDQVKDKYPDGSPGDAKIDSLIKDLTALKTRILNGTVSEAEDSYKDIIDPFNHPSPLSPLPAGSTTTSLSGFTIADLGACMGQATVGYDPLSTTQANGIACLGNFGGTPYWTYTDASGSTSYIIAHTNADATLSYYTASETGWRNCDRPADGLCEGLWTPLNIQAGTAAPNTTNPLVPAITHVVASPVGINTATISWNGHGTFKKYIVTYASGLQKEIFNTTGSTTGTINLTGLTEATNYAFTITAYDAGGSLLDTYPNGAFSTITEKLATPRNLQTTIVNATSVKITWDPDATHQSYELVYTEANGTQKTIPVLALSPAEGTTNSITISGLDSTFTYPFALVAKGTSTITAGKVMVSDPASGSFKTRLSQPCEDDMPVSVALADNLTSFRLTWVPIKGQTQTKVSYREVISTQSTPIWKDLGETNLTSFNIADLSLDAQYEYKATPICRVEGHSDITGKDAGGTVFTTKQKIKPIVDYACGKQVPVKNKNPTPINNLKVGDWILIGDFPAEVLSLEKDSSPYKGKAATLVPYLGMSNFLMAFDGLTVNPDYEVLAGNMVTITDPVLRQKIADARNNKDASKENAQKVEEKKYNQPVNSVVAKTGADGKPELNDKGQPVIRVTLADGTTAEMPVTENIRIVGSDGKEVSISKDGTMTPADGKSITPPAAIAMTDPTKLGDGSIIIKFSAAADQKFGFDGVTGGDGIWGRDNFKIGGATYYVPIKSIQPGVEDYVTFEQQGAGTTKFSLEMNGKATPIIPNGNRITLNIPFTGNAALFALDDKNQIIGKLTILSYPMVTKKVVLVSLNGSSLPDAPGLQTELNRVFAPGVASVQVSTHNFQTIAYDGSIDATREHYSYSDDMKAIVSEFKKSNNYSSDANTAYLFFGNSSTSGLEGVMNRGYQFGFIFSATPKVIAHELGHGLFALQHTEDDNSFDKAEGDLMSKSPATTTKLYKYQWVQMQNPPSVWGVMESGADAEFSDPSKKCKVFFVHGTQSSSNRWIENKNTIPILLKIAGCPNFDYKFSWNAPLNNDMQDRRIAANELKAYIMQKSRENDEIIVVGHSHGGNVALQTIDKLAIIRSVRVITIATPAYNEVKISGNKNPENPINILNFKAHTALWNIIDGVSGGAAGDDYFKNSRTINVEINVSKYYNSNQYLDAHSFDVMHPESILNAINSGQVSKIY